MASAKTTTWEQTASRQLANSRYLQKKADAGMRSVNIWTHVQRANKNTMIILLNHIKNKSVY